MVWFAVALFLAVALAMFVGRHKLSEAASLFLGGRFPPGCIVAQALTFVVLALLLLLFRSFFE